ncbi:MAG TPA: hypothetical protein VLL52_18030 [Anaerolineae bacterium]|nr:hypothetical protein [Anaerolineae bacterium]
MDILHLVDRLEKVLGESRRIFMTANLVVDEDQIYTIIDQMRVAIPEEIKRAKRIESEKDRVLAQAKEEADRIRQLAKQEAEELVKRDNIMATAQKRADTLLERSTREAEALKRDADAYVVDVLVKLEEDLLRSLSVVRNGVQKIQTDAKPSGSGAKSNENVKSK